MSFELDERLARDALVIGDWPLTRVLLMNDARWPWLILVPRREGLVELTDLELADQMQLMDEAGRASRFLKSRARADKINVCALGNIVRQLHLHVVARVVGDPAWPGPVWGHGAATPYDDGAARALIAAAREGLPIQPIQAGVDISLLRKFTLWTCIKSDDSEKARQPLESPETGSGTAQSHKSHRVNPRIAPRRGNRHNVRHPMAGRGQESRCRRRGGSRGLRK
jgi:diadenosine tetraphosphate (Ap4A) HIT family hydrolase